MALFLQAEGNEWAVCRVKEVQNMFRAAVAAAKGSNSSCSSRNGCSKCVPGDELYGLLAGWNLIHALVDGGETFTVKEVVDVMAWNELWKKQLMKWKGFEMIRPRIHVLKQGCVARFKVRECSCGDEGGGQECALMCLRCLYMQLNRLKMVVPCFGIRKLRTLVNHGFFGLGKLVLK
jgi:hypothetical protein